jgi:hypothetical protein
MYLKTRDKTVVPCLKCGFTRTLDPRDVCPICRRRDQSLTKYGRSNALDAPLRQPSGLSSRQIALLALGVALLVAFFGVLHRENARQAQMVERMERLR